MTHHTTQYPTPPVSYEMLLSQALYEGYLKPVQYLMQRKIQYWEALTEQDRFKLSPDENNRLQRRLNSITDEIRDLENLMHAVTDMASLYWQHLDQVKRERDEYFDRWIKTAKRLRPLKSSISHP